MVRSTENVRLKKKKDSDPALLCIDEYAIEQIFAQFTKAVAGKPSTRRRDSASLLSERFLQSTVAGGPAHMGMAQSNDVVTFLCWLDSCSEKRRTAVYARDCKAVGTSELSNCPTTEEGCTLRYAHDSLRTNYVSKLAMAYERDLGVTHDWNSALRTCNPVRSDLVTQYMAFIREKKKKAGVEVSQAPAMLHSHLAAIIAYIMTLRLRCTQDPSDRAVLARDIALFTVAFNILLRGDGLSRTLLQRILRLPNECGFLFNFQWGKTMPDGADHLMIVEYDTKRMTTCPIRPVEQYIAVGTALGWNMTQGYLFPRISRRPNTGAPIRGKTSISAPDMTKALKVHARNAGERTAFTMHSFRSGGALTRALTGEDLPTVIQRAFWKNGLEIPQTHGSTNPRICRKLDGNRGIPRTAQRKLTSSDSLNKIDTGLHSGTRPWYDDQRERKYGGVQSRNTNKGFNIRANHQLYSIK